jgi:hypothetical protein
MNATKKLKREARRLSQKFIPNAEDHLRNQENFWNLIQDQAPGTQLELEVLGDLQYAKIMLREYKERYNDIRDLLVLRRMTPEERFFARFLRGCFPFI